jgi:hypothetical protein
MNLVADFSIEITDYAPTNSLQLEKLQYGIGSIPKNWNNRGSSS